MLAAATRAPAFNPYAPPKGAEARKLAEQYGPADSILIRQIADYAQYQTAWVYGHVTAHRLRMLAAELERFADGYNDDELDAAVADGLTELRQYDPKLAELLESLNRERRYAKEALATFKQVMRLEREANREEIVRLYKTIGDLADQAEAAEEQGLKAPPVVVTYSFNESEPEAPGEAQLGIQVAVLLGLLDDVTEGR